MAGEWNLIVNACRACNEKKARLEDDISAITMQPDIAGRHAIDNPHLRDEAARKGKGAISRSTKRPVRESVENLKFSTQLMPGVTIDFDMYAAPQLDHDRGFELAMYQIRAFFYMITYDEVTQRGRYWQGIFAPAIFAPKLDWGNVVLVGFQRLISSWDCRVIAIGASEFFKVLIRRSPDSRPVWAWAVQWNCNHRLVGFFGDETAVNDLFKQLPRLRVSRIDTGPNSYIDTRLDVPLAPADDVLFIEPQPHGPADSD